MSSNCHIAVLGAGLIGRRHIQHVVAEPLTTLAGIVEPTPSGRELASKLGVPWFESADDMLAAKATGVIQLDGAIVGTPTDTHVTLAIKLAKAGVHVLVEKPVAPTAEQAQVLVEALDSMKEGPKVLVGQHRRFNPYVVALKAALVSGRLGTIIGASGMWAVRKGPSEYYEGWHGEREQGGGTISINMIHDMDLFRYLLGEIDTVYCVEGPKTRSLSVEESGGVVLRFRSGAVGTFFFSDAAASPFCFEAATGENPDIVGNAYGKDVYHIFGTNGSICLPSLLIHQYPSTSPVAVSTSIPNESGETDNWLFRLCTDDTYARMAQSLANIPPLTLQLQHFVEVIQGEVEPVCSASEGLKSVRAVEGLAESMMERREVRL